MLNGTKIRLGREVCGDLAIAAAREWLVTNGIGGYASGTVAGLLTRRYHGLLIAALKPPLERTLMFTKLDETAVYADRCCALSTNCWSDGTVDPQGYQLIEHFCLEGTIPVWRYALADALLEKRVWMQRGQNTTYIHYSLIQATGSLKLSLRALVNYRDYHGITAAKDWPLVVASVDQGIQMTAHADAVPLYLLSHQAVSEPAHTWYDNFYLAIERYRGLSDHEDHFHAASFTTRLNPGESLTIVASTISTPNLDGEAALKQQEHYENGLIQLWDIQHRESPTWIKQLVLAADQFIVDRPSLEDPDGKTIIAGYPWFSDWGRDTMISLPGLTLATGRPEIARSILRTFARYVDRGMVPNRFPDAGETPEYNTFDASLWYFEAVRAYMAATGDVDLLRELFPVLVNIIDWHCQGTRYNIHLDQDGLLYGGEAGTQLTWMDAKVGDWVVTPRIGKPIEINALWYNALRSLARFAQILGKPNANYTAMGDRTQESFSRFWNPALGYCYDVLDTSDGDDASLRPNQIFAVSLPESPLTPAQQQAVVEICERMLLTSYGLRSLSPDHLQYQGHYGGDQRQRDGAYHQGTVWGWLLGPFVLAHLRVYQNPTLARQFLQPMADHLLSHGIGNLSEIFDGDPPFSPRGCFAQAWTVAETLRTWLATGKP